MKKRVRVDPEPVMKPTVSARCVCVFACILWNCFTSDCSFGEAGGTNEMCVPASAKQELLRDIFGWKQHSTYYSGLLDAQSSEQFYERLGALKPKWDNLEMNSKKCAPEFHDWVVKYHPQMMVKSMIAPVRESAGLGSPPEQYTQNRVESMNRVLKDTSDHHKCSWVQLNDMLQTIVREEHVGFERALYGSGEYKLKTEYSQV